MLTFVEETCLLLLDEKSGEYLPIHPNILECALVGAVLVDLAFAYRIDTDPKALIVGDRTPTGEPMLDRILAIIADHPETIDTSAWIKTLARDEAADLQKQALDRLVVRGILGRREKKSLLGFLQRPQLDERRRGVQEIKKRMKALILSDEIPDPRDVALLSLVDACNILPDVFPGGEIKNASARIKQLRNMDMVGPRRGWRRCGVGARDRGCARARGVLMRGRSRDCRGRPYRDLARRRRLSDGNFVQVPGAGFALDPARIPEGALSGAHSASPRASPFSSVLRHVSMHAMNSLRIEKACPHFGPRHHRCHPRRWRLPSARFTTPAHAASRRGARLTTSTAVGQEMQLGAPVFRPESPGTNCMMDVINYDF